VGRPICLLLIRINTRLSHALAVSGVLIDDCYGLTSMIVFHARFVGPWISPGQWLTLDIENL
jgi:hypothetical protein